MAKPMLVALSYGITRGLKTATQAVSTCARRNPVALFYLSYFIFLLAFLVLFLVYLYRT
jgi:hypothetical protein